jgi:hypothetical protein
LSVTRAFGVSKSSFAILVVVMIVNNPRLAIKKNAFNLVNVPFSKITKRKINDRIRQLPITAISLLLNFIGPPKNGRIPKIRVNWLKTDPIESPILMSAWPR